MILSDGLMKLKRLFGAESSDGLQEQLASLRLAVGQGEETIRPLRAELLAVKEELRAAKQELAAEKTARQAAEAALADEKGTNAALKKAVRKLSLELHHALARLDTDSGNSSKPPSSDFPKKPRKSGDAKPDPKSLRKRRGRRPGPLKGHRGAGFSLPEGPPGKIVYCLPFQCGGGALAGLCADRERAAGTHCAVDCVVKVKKTVYKAVARKCPLRDGELLAGEFPEEARSTKQYGRRIRLLPVAMYNCCTCSFDTISRVLSLITGLDLYVGLCLEQHDRAGHRRETEEVKEEVKARLLDEKVVSADETARCCGKNAWIHAASAPGLTLQHASMKRGVLLWACEHGHGQEEGRQNWALELVCFLRSLNSMRKEPLERGGKSFRRKTVDNFRERFDELVEEGLAASEAAEELKGGATLRKTRALPRRQEKRKDDFLRFLEDVDVPFTSSEAERDLRSHKGRMAISGCFRTVRGLASHANLSTVIKTLMKAGKSRLEAADAAMNGRPVDLLPPRRSPELES